MFYAAHEEADERKWDEDDDRRHETLRSTLDMTRREPSVDWKNVAEITSVTNKLATVVEMRAR